MSKKEAIPKRISNFEVFILLLTILSMVNLLVYLLPLPTQIKEVFAIMGNVYCFFFLIDFFLRLKKSKQKSDYFIKHFGFLDLLGSIPYAPLAIFRLYRATKYFLLLKRYTIKRLLNDINERRSESALFLVMVLLLVVLQFGGSTVLWAESLSPDSNIKTAGDSLWWGVVTVTTVGYGDRYPVTPIGRYVGVLMMFIGVGTFGVLTSYLANSLLAPPKKES